jgi:hypothetical protein
MVPNFFAEVHLQRSGSEVSNAHPTTVMDAAKEGKGRRAVIPPEIVKELEALSSQERSKRLRSYTEEHGEEVEPVDGWIPYGPKVNDIGGPVDHTE